LDGIGDMGGMQGFGTVSVEPDEPVFHEEWERRAFAMALLSMRVSGTNLDAFRHAGDRLHPVDYLVDGYYGRWLGMAETLLTDSGIIAPGAVDARARKLRGEDATEPPPPSPNKPDYQPTAAGSLRQVDTPPAFGVGDRVRARDIHPTGHTRLPRYVRGRVGVVRQIRPGAVLPDTNAHFLGENAQHVYSVEFDARELWGMDSEPFALSIDLYESYLEEAK
jgi:nitrile hydratase beta subunit